MNRQSMPVAAALALAAAAPAAPNAHNLEAFAERLVNERSRLIVVADSIWSEDAAGRMLVGVRDMWNIDFRGWTIMSNSTAIDCLGMVQQAASVPDEPPFPAGQGFGRDVVGNVPPAVPPFNLYMPGALNISPKMYMESRFRGDWTRLSPFWRGLLQAGNPNSSGVDFFSQFRRGSWLTNTMTATAIFYHDPATTLSRFVLTPYRNGALAPAGGVGVQPTIPGVNAFPVNCDGVGEPWIQFEADTLVEQAYDPVTPTPNSNLVILGAHFEDQTAVTGCSLSTIANGGWTAADHIDPAMCTDANLGGYLSAVGLPDLVLIQLGANAEASEIDIFGNLAPQWKANIEALIARYRALLTLKGPPPLFLLVAQYDLGPSFPRLPAIAEALHEISVANSDVAYVNLFSLAGPHAQLQANSYLADGVHPNAAGSDYFAERIWIALANAVCPGDTTGDRLVDFIDLNRILSEFGTTANGLVGDVNNDGVVDFLDLNIILSNFGSAC